VQLDLRSDEKSKASGSAQKDAAAQKALHPSKQI